MGDGQALQECLDAVKKDYKTLWETYDVPPFKYSDTKYLPQILELLQLTWDLPESFNTWYSRLRDTLRQMASQSVQQFTEVVCALEKLVESDAKYSTINYFIGELRCNQEPIVVGAKPMTVKQAMQFINEL